MELRISLPEFIGRILPGAKAWHKQNSCTRKIRYPRKSAINAAIHMQEKTGNAFDVYECPFCKGWHIGKSQ